MTEPDEVRASRFACRAVLRDALSSSGPLDARLREHVDACSFCAARLQARDRLVPFLRQQPELPAEVKARLSGDVQERIVRRAENGPLGRLLAGGIPLPAADIPEQDGWLEPLLESRVARQVADLPPSVDASSWARVRSSILDQVAGAPRRRTRRHWWIGLIGTAVAAGIVLVVVRPDNGALPTITFRDIANLPVGASLPGVDFAVIRNGATR